MRSTAALYLVPAAILAVGLSSPATAKAESPKPTTAPAQVQAPAMPAAAAAAKPNDFVLMAELKVPALDEDFLDVPVARVDGDVITLDEFMETVAAQHQDRTAAGAATMKDAQKILQRLVDVRLLLAEARATGVADDAEYKTAVSENRIVAARAAVMASASDSAKADPAETELFFRDVVQEWRVRSLLFEKEADAKAFVAASRAGKSFDELVKAAVAAKTATAADGEGFLKWSTFIPPALQAVGEAKVGRVSAPFQVKGGFSVLRLEEIRYPEDPAVRARAAQQSLESQQAKAASEHYQKLRKRWVKSVDERLLGAINFDAKRPGLAALSKDQRVLVRFQGSKETITVADLTFGVSQMFFHGMEEAATEKRVDSKKAGRLEKMISDRVLDFEAAERKVDQTRTYQRSARRFANSTLLGAFLKRVVAPGVSVGPEDVRAYYDTHQAEYTGVSFYTIDSIAFPTADKAQVALDRLHAGADFKWLKQNADGRLPADQANPDLTERTLLESALPAALRKALAGVRPGDYRLYAADDGKCYALVVSAVTPPAVSPFGQVKDDIGKKLFGEAMAKSIEEWVGKLRKGYRVETFLKNVGS